LRLTALYLSGLAARRALRYVWRVRRYAIRWGVVPLLVGIVLLVGCSEDATLLGTRVTCFQCLHDDCLDPNGYMIGYYTKRELYSDGTDKESESWLKFGPNACGDTPSHCLWQRDEKKWECQ